MTTERHIGAVNPVGKLHHATCAECAWQLRKRAHADAVSLLRSHYRIAHLNDTSIYLED